MVFTLAAALAGNTMNISMLSVMAAEQKKYVSEAMPEAEKTVPTETEEAGGSKETETENPEGKGTEDLNPSGSAEKEGTDPGGTEEKEGADPSGTTATEETKTSGETKEEEPAQKESEATEENSATDDRYAENARDEVETPAEENQETVSEVQVEESDESQSRAGTPAYNPYYTPDPGTAVPASPSGVTPAVPYVFTEKTLSPGLFSNTTQYRAEFTAPTAGEDYGSVTFENNGIQYTPNAAAAGKIVEFTVYGRNDSGQETSGGIHFTVQVSNQPTDVGNNADLSGLSYKVGSGSYIPVPDFSPDITAYTVKLPVGTARNQLITLSGTQADSAASVGYTSATTQWEADKETAEATVTAQNGATEKTYSVTFYVAPQDEEPSVYSSANERWNDGDTIYLENNTEKQLWISAGAGDMAAGSFSVMSSDMTVLPIAFALGTISQ